LLLPLVRHNKLVGAFGSQIVLRWRQFEVRRRVKAKALGALDVELTRQQLNDNPALGQAVFEITFGHPFANEVVFGLVFPQDSPLDWLKENRISVAEQVVAALQKRILSEMTAELKQIFGVIALFREFDVNTLRVVLPKFYPEFEHRSQSALIISIKQLLDTRLVSWSDEQRAYQIDTTVRRIFAHALELSDPERYAAIRAAAVDYYAQLIRDIPGSRNVYFVEFCYHSLYKADWQMYNQEQIQEIFEQFFRYYISPDGRFLDQQSITGLRELLSKDQELLEALQRHNLPATALVETLDDFRTRAETVGQA
jgi:hypothetical protein